MTSSERTSLLEFPCPFALKVMGVADADFTVLVKEIVLKHAEVDADAFTERPSRGGKYVSVTVYLQARSQQQLDNLYRELSAHERILMAL